MISVFTTTPLMLDSLPKHKKIILFDGICNLCNHSISTINKHDKNNAFVFASLQSEVGKKIVTYLGINTSKIDSIILFEPQIAYHIKATAVLKIMNEFGGFWKISQIIYIIPSPLRDLCYNFIAKNRYKWFGKKEHCVLPTPELMAKFLD